MRSESGGSGLKAYGLLHERFNRRTLSRVMRVHREVMYPKKVTEVKNLMQAIVAWEAKWMKMVKEEENRSTQENKITIPTIWKMAAFIELCPKDIGDRVLRAIDEIGERYETLREKVVGWATNKAEASGPSAMDINSADQKEEHWPNGPFGGWENDQDYEEQGDEIGAVTPNTKCFNCFGYGHISRDCPKGKGKAGGGKGGFGGGGGKGGFGGGYGKGGYGGGYGKSYG